MKKKYVVIRRFSLGETLKSIILFIVLQIVLMIPILNVFLVTLDPEDPMFSCMKEEKLEIKEESD